MKMDGGETLKLSSTSSTKPADTDGLTFGPAWLRQLSSGDSSKITALPPSPGMPFQLAKHRYSKEEMLAIYDNIESKLAQHPPPPLLAKEFEELFRRDMQRPVLLVPPSAEEQKFLSTCVNSQVILNTYNKYQSGSNSSGGGRGGSNSSGGLEAGGGSSSSVNNVNNSSSTSASNSRHNSEMRGGGGEGGRGGYTGRGGSRGGGMSASGGGRGEIGRGLNNSNSLPGGSGGRGRGGRGGRGGGGAGAGPGGSEHYTGNKVGTIEEEGRIASGKGANSSVAGGGQYNKSSSFGSSRSNQWGEEKDGVKSEKYSRGGVGGHDDNWRNRGQHGNNDEAESNEEQAEREVDEDIGSDDARNESNEKRNDKPNAWRNQTTDSTKTNNQWSSSNKKPLSSSQQSSTPTDSNRPKASYSDISKRTLPNRNNPEWLNDDDENNAMTFDENGKFVYVKDLKNKQSAANSGEKKVEPERKETVSSGEKAATVSSDKSNENDAESSKQQPRNQTTASSSTSSSKPAETAQTSNVNSSSQSTEILNHVQNSEKILNVNDDILQQQMKLQKNIQLFEENLSKQQLLDMTDPIANFSSAPTAIPESLANLQSIYDSNLKILQQQQQPSPSAAQLNQDPKLGAVSIDHPDSLNWFYMDPQNQIQGPFNSEQMAGWLAAGYFALTLMIKRGCDEKFLPLGLVTKNWGRVPFTPGPQPPPFTNTNVNNQAAAAAAASLLKQASLAQSQQSQAQTGNNWTKEQLIQHLQVYQQLQQQLQLFPQNFNLMRNELTASNLANNLSLSNIGTTVQQLMQLQVQQKLLANNNNPSLTNLNNNNLINELRLQQESLINQFVQNNQVNPNLLSLAQQQLLQQPRIDPSSILNDPTVIDPAILGAAPTPPIVNTQSQASHLWGDLVASRLSPMNQQPSPTISPINNLIQEQQRLLEKLESEQHAAFKNNVPIQMMNDLSIKDKLHALFEDNKKKEEERRKLEEEYKLKIKEETEKRKKEEMIRHEEERLRKEQQKKKIEEMIKKADEEKRVADELKKRKEEEKLLKQKQKEELKKQEMQQKELLKEREEAEKKRQLELQAENARKQAELEKQKLKAQQEQLNNLQLPATAQWAKMQASQQGQTPPLELRKILEQQSLEQKFLMEQMKQAELSNSQNHSSSSWSSLFRGQAQQLSPPPPTSNNSIGTSSQVVSLTSIQAEQSKSTDQTATPKPATMSQKIQQQQPPTVSSKQPWSATNATSSSAATNKQGWAAWGSGPSGTNSNSSQPSSINKSINLNESGKNTTSSVGGFWNEVSDNNSKKPSNNNNASNGNKNSNSHANQKHKTNNQFPDLHNHNQRHHNNHQNEQNNTNHKHSRKANQIEESLQQTFLRNMTISEEFMKWCTEQLKDFHVELHIPTFVNFLREIETCEEIEDYVVNYLGDSNQAKEFAQQFYINREGQLKQQNSVSNGEADDSYGSHSKQQQQKNQQKKRTKGHKLDSQLLGFTVQADPNLKNRGDIDQDL